MSDDILKHRILRLESELEKLQCSGCKDLQKKLELGQKYYSDIVLQLSKENSELRKNTGVSHGGSTPPGFMRFSGDQAER